MSTSTTSYLRRRGCVLWKDDLMHCDHASFSRAFDLSELLDDLTVGRIMEEHDPQDSSASGILINRIDGH